MQPSELSCCALKLHIFLKLFSEVHGILKKCSVIKWIKNIDQCSTVECTAGHPRLTKSPKEEEKSLFFSVLVFLLALVERFGVSRVRD